MNQNSSPEGYDYSSRKGVYLISWNDFGTLARRLAEKLAVHHPNAIVGVSRAGLIPAAELAYMLRLDLHPVSLTRRVSDRVVYQKPVWRAPVPAEVAGKVVVVVDEIAGRGETLAMVAGEVRARGAAKVITACLVSHSWANPPPDVTALVSDALVIFPWGRHIWKDGRWQAHPEYAAALQIQGVEADILDEK